MKRTLSVLLAEDDASMRTAATVKMTKAGYKVISAADGAEAWELFKSNDVDVCLIDILMPIMGGNELIKLIRKENPNVPIYLFTNFSDKQLYMDALTSGIDGVLVKANITLSDLVEFLRQMERGGDIQPFLHEEENL